MSDIDVEILSDGTALAGRSADVVAEKLVAAIDARGRATLAVSGGSTPAAFLAELAGRKLPWEAVHVFQVDERVAPPGHPDRNLTGLREALLDRVPIPPGGLWRLTPPLSGGRPLPPGLHPMPVEEPDLEAAAVAYGEEIRAVTGPEGRLDVVHLGVGDDGHTASWPPGDPVIDATDDVAVVGPFNGRLRMTLTPPAVNRAGWIVWLITGSAKAPVVARFVAGDPALPASRVRRNDVTLLADPAAGAELAAGG